MNQIYLYMNQTVYKTLHLKTTAGNNRFELIRWANQFKSIRYGKLKTNGVRFGRGHIVRSLQTCTAPSHAHGCLAPPSADLHLHRSINLPQVAVAEQSTLLQFAIRTSLLC